MISFRNQEATQNSYALNTPSTNLQEPVYSVINDQPAASPSLPKPPYYQEIESDLIGADYEAPIKKNMSG